MASLAVGVVERIFRAGLAIKKAAQTVRRNKKECRDIERCVARIGALLVLLNERTGVMQHPAISGPLEDLAESLEEALELVTECQCQGTNAVRRLLAAGDMAKQLRGVRDDILRKLALGDFAFSVQVTITLTNPIRCAGGGSHPLLTRLRDAGEVEISCCTHSNTGDARSGGHMEVTMEATANELPYAALSGFMESTSSELEASLHHSSELHVKAGGLKQKFVLKVSMPCDKSRSKARALVAKVDGVSSMKITGDAKNLIEVVGGGVDAFLLVRRLRKKIGHAELLPMEELKDKKPDERKPEEPEVLQQLQPEAPPPVTVPARHSRRLVPCALMCALVVLASVWALH